ncbi:hypothetical protein AArcSl_0392 [Halalkaliarchaeum desulfuricum]|uniref:Halobacterial output domain-containing protein n=1 Tax=Halalkaliarchaeum desulfuricum TaxID=2055893 RepID=A0A343TG23_9EURY|nr:hypothetical protein [Halalkaliarchaeum desulfuricum]AUX08045.1 hypothetical protein AArcSl_0392 [Halalkaliarchaeum desulfuricum]
MSSSERKPDLLVSYSLSSGEEITEAVVNAFLAVEVDVHEKPTTLHDWVEADVFETLDWTCRPVRLSTRIWGHWVAITAEEVRIYRDGGPSAT